MPRKKKMSSNIAEIDPEQLLNFDVMFNMDMFPGENEEENEVFFNFDSENETK